MEHRTPVSRVELEGRTEVGRGLEDRRPHPRPPVETRIGQLEARLRVERMVLDETLQNFEALLDRSPPEGEVPVEKPTHARGEAFPVPFGAVDSPRHQVAAVRPVAHPGHPEEGQREGRVVLDGLFVEFPGRGEVRAPECGLASQEGAERLDGASVERGARGERLAQPGQTFAEQPQGQRVDRLEHVVVPGRRGTRRPDDRVGTVDEPRVQFEPRVAESGHGAFEPQLRAELRLQRRCGRSPLGPGKRREDGRRIHRPQFGDPVEPKRQKVHDRRLQVARPIIPAVREGKDEETPGRGLGDRRRLLGGGHPGHEGVSEDRHHDDHGPRHLLPGDAAGGRFAGRGLPPGLPAGPGGRAFRSADPVGERRGVGQGGVSVLGQRVGVGLEDRERPGTVARLVEEGHHAPQGALVHRFGQVQHPASPPTRRRLVSRRVRRTGQLPPRFQRAAPEPPPGLVEPVLETRGSRHVESREKVAPVAVERVLPPLLLDRQEESLHVRIEERRDAHVPLPTLGDQVLVDLVREHPEGLTERLPGLRRLGVRPEQGQEFVPRHPLPALRAREREIGKNAQPLRLGQNPGVGRRAVRQERPGPENVKIEAHSARNRSENV